MIIAASREFFHLPIEDWARLVQITAIIVGAIAAYIKWFRGRLYHTRLEVSVAGSLVGPPTLRVEKLERELVQELGSSLVNPKAQEGPLVEAFPSQLLATARVKNVGFSKVPIKQKGTGLRIFSPITGRPTSDILSVEWKHEGTFPVFEAHQWIESSETIEDQLLVTLPEGHSGIYRLELRLTSGRIVWKAAGIQFRKDKK